MKTNNDELINPEISNEMRIREILSERPHIPNAREAKEIRRRRAKFGIKMNSAR